jgi:hypothetical protein
MNTDQLPSLYDNDSGSSVGYRKDSGIGPDSILTNIVLESVEYLLWQENHLGFFAALRITYDDFAVFDVRRGEFQHLPTLMQPRAMSSRISRFLGSCVLKMISSTISFERGASLRVGGLDLGGLRWLE